MITRRDFLKVTAAGGALASLGSVTEAKAAMKSAVPDEGFCHEGARKIPVIAEVDLVVAGGSSRAIAAAVAAAKTGSRVYLVGYMPYLGEDICGSHLYEREAGEKLQTALARKLFPGKNFPTPLHIKKTLEDELIDNNVQFLYSSYVTNVLTDPSGKPAGVVIANRSGRQAIRCKAIIDATHNASVAGLLGAERKPFIAGSQEFCYTVVGNTPKEAPEIIQAEELSQPIKVGEKSYPVTRYTFHLPLKDDSYASLAEVEQIIRNWTWDIDQVDSSDLLWYIPKQTINSEKAYNGNPVSWRKLPMQAFMCLSRLDALITALGNARDTSVLPTILEKAKKLEPEDYLSHFRAITMATEAIGSREAVSVLLAMLTTPGVRGHSILSFAEARSNAVPDLNDTSTRNLALKELHLARALYLCGDQDGIGEEVLRRYADGLQGHYARYAQEILNSK